MPAPTFSLADKWHLVEHLFFLIGLNWRDDEEATRPEPYPGDDPDVGEPAEEFFLGRPRVSAKELFVGILAKLVGQVAFRQVGAADLGPAKQSYLRLRNPDRWDVLFSLLSDVERSWDEGLVAHYNIPVSFEELLHTIAGAELFRR